MKNQMKIVIDYLKYNSSQIKKGICIFLGCFLILNSISLIKDNYEYRRQIHNELNTLTELWNKKDISQVSQIAKTSPESFLIETGFENTEDIYKIIETHIFGEVEFQESNLTIDNWSLETPVAKGKIVVCTYDNLAILNEVIEQLVNDDTEIDMNYNHEDFVKRNLVSIQEAIKDTKKDYIKTIIVTFDYDKENDKWFIPFESNKEFYNAISGNMISFNEEVDTHVEI